MRQLHFLFLTCGIPFLSGIAFGGPVTGDGFMGHVGTAFTINDTGWIRSHFSFASLTDGNSATYDDTWPLGASDYDYVGMRFTTAQNGLSTVSLMTKHFFDGGWWEGPGPILQVTTSNAFTSIVLNNHLNNFDGIWTTVSTTTNYPTTGTSGISSGTIVDGATYTWTLLTPANNVTGFRLIGLPGGTGSDVDGFLGAREISASAVVTSSVPEPATLPALLILVGATSWTVFRRRRGSPKGLCPTV
ncbi:MAG: PEP-CTERM sorting domain-containing protein [Planctomycetaceae bacterium]|nr:PEP-CTERM sorting domain-containing protein [Planctomycetaceae bacterium]